MNPPREAYPILAALGGVLTFASLIGFLFHLRAKDDRGRAMFDNLNARIRAWWLMVIVLSGACLAGRKAVILLFTVVSFGALRELVTVTSTRQADRAALIASFFIALPAQYGLIWIGWYGLFAIFIPVYAFLVLPILAVLSSDTKNFLERTAETQWSLMLSVYCISYVPALLTLEIPRFQHRMTLLIAFLLIVAQSSDVFQYVFGRLVGRYKIAPNLSPSKTVEGFIGGIVSATALGAGLWRITPFSRGQAAVMALMISLTGFLGGLVMSAIKRDRDIKDWSHLIRGHGGILDRLDSICFSAPIFFHLTRYFFT